MDNIESLLPWYINDTLSPSERRKVEQWLAAQPDRERVLAPYQQIHQAALERSLQPVPPGVEGRLRTHIRSQVGSGFQKVTPTHWNWAFGFLLMLVVLVSLWFTFQPGVVLEWSAGGQPIEFFQVYRATKGSESFELINEVPSDVAQGRYSFVDLAVWPGQSYSYQVVGVTEGGQTTNSPVVTGDTWVLIQTQLAIVVISLVIGYGGGMVVRYWRPVPRAVTLAIG